MVDAPTIFGSKILIVDDQDANIQLVETILKRAGYLNVSSTMDPKSVRELHLKNRYDLIVLDLQMPEMDGFEVMDGLKTIETGGYLSVLVLTGQPSHKPRAMQAGAKDFVSKPFDRSEMLTRIHYMLEVRLLHEEVTAHNRQLEEMVQERTAELRTSEEMFRELAANIPEALWIRDAELRQVKYVNPAWQKLSGSTAAPGDSLESIHRSIHPDDLQWVSNDRRATDAVACNEYRLVHSDGSVRWVRARTFPITNPSGKAPWIVEIIEDVTQSREAQHKLVHLANHDALTGLPNRALLYESLRNAVARARDEKSAVSFFLIDIDFFKTVNDNFGHTIGDALLREFASTLAGCVRPGDMVGRLGGDEFAMVVTTPIDSQAVLDVANRIRNALQVPLSVEGRSIPVTASIGIASCPDDASDLESLIRCADVAMYEAKASGRNAVCSHNAEINRRALEKSDLEAALLLALDRDEFTLCFQPKIQVDSGMVKGVEALIRWKRPGHGLVLPGLFIPALESMGLILRVGAWVIDTACRQIRAWEKSGLGRIPIAVNVSSKQIHEERFVSQVGESVREHGIDPGLLEFEITESTLMAHGEATDVALRKLRELGISISIDDFGTGYSSLAYLKRFPVDALKIDIDFIRDVTTNANDAAITVAIITMAHSLRLKVVAEGVETTEQLDFLRIHGCDEVQGYLLSKPLPADEIAEKFRRSFSFGTGQRIAPSNARPKAAYA